MTLVCVLFDDCLSWCLMPKMCGISCWPQSFKATCLDLAVLDHTIGFWMRTVGYAFRIEVCISGLRARLHALGKKFKGMQAAASHVTQSPLAALEASNHIIE